MSDPATALSEFDTYVETHLSGDEKGETADFLEAVFRVRIYGPVREIRANPERWLG